jgi:trans-aconitate methyltransferase
MSDIAYFNALYEKDDPFQYRTRWYEQRKRALTLASLPRERFARGWELGCSNGVLTAALAERCDQLLATDLSDGAVLAARAMTRRHAHVCIEQARHPQDWPAGRFDLIVLGEMGYYLSPEDMQQTAAQVVRSLMPQGVVIACHWRVPFEQARCSASFVHAQLDDCLPRLFSYRDEDMLLEGWSADTTSVAEREGLR